MDDNEKYDVLRRLLEMQHQLRNVVEAAEVQGTLARAAGADALAFAAFMLRESLMVYSRELSRFVTNYIGTADDE